MVEHEKRGPGRPAVPESERARTVGISLRPRAVSLLQAMSSTQRRSQSEIVEAGLQCVLRDQHETFLRGREIFEAAIEGWTGLKPAGAPDFQLQGWWIYDPGNRGQEFIYIRDAALYQIGLRSDRPEWIDGYMAAFLQAPRLPVIYIDVDEHDPSLFKLVPEPMVGERLPLEEYATATTRRSRSLREVVFELARDMRVFADMWEEKPSETEALLPEFWKRFPFQSYAKVKDRIRNALGSQHRFEVRAASDILPHTVDAIRELADDLEGDGVKLPPDVLA